MADRRAEAQARKEVAAEPVAKQADRQVAATNNNKKMMIKSRKQRTWLSALEREQEKKTTVVKIQIRNNAIIKDSLISRFLIQQLLSPSSNWKRNQMIICLLFILNMLCVC